MGCVSSKRVEASVASDVYRPPPTSVALFDVSTIEEPWLLTTANATDDEQQEIKKPALVLLDKLDAYVDVAPKSWLEVSKALEDLKPSLQAAKTTPLLPTPPLPLPLPLPPPQAEPRTTPPPELKGFRSVRENSFVLRDRQEREAAQKETGPRPWKRRDPLEGYPESRPPGNEEGVVLYTTTLRGVRRTFEDCERARRALEGLAAEAEVAVDERDVSLHGEYLKELRELVGEGVVVPRLFIRGRYVGGAEEVVELGDTGKLREMLRSAAKKEGTAKYFGACDGCGGARFVPCLVCNGSCKVVGEDGKGVLRCGKCNENGLVLCPLCH